MSIKKYILNNWLLHVFAILFIIILCFFNIQKLDYIAVLNDEFGYWANAASIAGYNWKELIAQTPYYSWGYSLLLIPIIVLLPTPELWYKAAIGLNGFLLVGTYLICSRFGRKLFPDANEKIIYLISLAVIIYPANIAYAQVAWSETLLYFMMWLSAYFMVSLDKDFSYKKLITEVIILVYMYAIHARTIGIIGISVFCLFFILIKHKKNLWLFGGIFLLLLAGYLTVSNIKSLQLSMLWSNSQASDLNNVSLSTETLSMYFSRIINDVKLLIESLGGKLFYLLLGSALTISVAFIQFVKELIQNIKGKVFFDNYIITKFWCICSLIIMWFICSLQMLNWAERKDMVVYSRYMENALGPALFLGLFWSIQKVKEVRWGIIVSAILYAVGIYKVYFRISNAGSYFNSICSPIIGAYYDNLDKNCFKAFVWITISISIIFVVFLMSTFLKKYQHAVILVCITIFYIIVGYKSNTYMLDARQYFDSSTVPIMLSIRSYYPDKEIYYVKNPDIDPYSVNPKYLQFTIPDKSIHLIDFEDIEYVLCDDVIVMTNPKDQIAENYLNTIDNKELIQTTGLLNEYLIR